MLQCRTVVTFWFIRSIVPDEIFADICRRLHMKSRLCHTILFIACRFMKFNDYHICEHLGGLLLLLNYIVHHNICDTVIVIVKLFCFYNKNFITFQ